jgi:hypothetical protein
VYAPELVEDIRVRTRLDAIYRSAYAIFTEPQNARWVKKNAALCLNQLAPAAGPMDNAALSNRRYDALDRVFRLGESRYLPFTFLRQDFLGLKRQFALDAPSNRERFFGPKERMAAEDDQALARLANGPSGGASRRVRRMTDSTKHPCEGMTASETKAFERIAAGMAPRCSAKTIEKLLGAGLIERHKRTVAVDRLGPVFVYEYSVPIAVHFQWCEHVSRPRAKGHRSKRPAAAPLDDLPLSRR